MISVLSLVVTILVASVVGDLVCCLAADQGNRAQGVACAAVNRSVHSGCRRSDLNSQ